MVRVTDRILQIIDDGLAACPAYEPRPGDFGQPARPTPTLQSGGPCAVLSWTAGLDGRRHTIKVPRGTYELREPFRIDGKLKVQAPYRAWSHTTGRPVVFVESGPPAAKRLRTNQ